MSYIQVYMSVMLFAFLVYFVVTLFKRQAQRPKFEQNAQATKDENKKPTIMLGYDETLARKLKHNPLFQSVYSDCEKAQTEFSRNPGAFSALIMDIMYVVNRHAIRHREIDANLWSGIIIRKMFPQRYK
ncbi:hypothetical protein L1285_13920 [Pseudoalteromonas sp. DL2-H2.2]|uniref:hypothetical protein n=1 Tax=Pseudoalteromonas sp. DL2-H2.2 TaxID=2908889 RepID=UPI001F32D57E|nr:hypothetical protein [Pseudoalteromonas sp. DL2-H2.2]MCF2909417.1 hypothetical protein [Pseudoalteromonas sp. DL2-H2.2]